MSLYIYSHTDPWTQYQTLKGVKPQYCIIWGVCHGSLEYNTRGWIFALVMDIV